MSDFHPTHKLTFTPAAISATTTFEVMLTPEGAAYTREEYEAGANADWEVVDGEWLCCGEATPGGANGVLEVARLWTGPFVALSPHGAVEYDAGQACDGLVNLTPHPLVVDFGGFKVTIPSHGVARVKSEPADHALKSLTLWVPDCLVPSPVPALRFTTEVVAQIGGADLELGREPYFAPVEPAPGMWSRASGPRIYFVVSLLTALALPGHPNLLVPGEEIRDAEGRIIGCRGLRRIV